MIIECSKCNSNVDGKIIGEHELGIVDGVPYKIAMLVCPVCKNVLLGESEMIQVGYDDWDWSGAGRLWPDPNQHIDPCIPANVRRALEDANKCFKAKVYSACAVMCGKAIEAVCVERTGARTLYDGLKKLKSQKEIDDRLYNWGEALRKERNIGAHANDEITSRADAQDILDFSIAICEYIFVLSEKYDEYIERKNKKAASKKKVAAKKKSVKKKSAIKKRAVKKKST